MLGIVLAVLFGWVVVPLLRPHLRHVFAQVIPEALRVRYERVASGRVYSAVVFGSLTLAAWCTACLAFTHRIKADSDATLCFTGAVMAALGLSMVFFGVLAWRNLSRQGHPAPTADQRS